MSITRITRTSIWKSTLSAQENDEFQAEREVLRNAFLLARKNTSHLVGRIASTLPELTQHEITHLDALWETASILVGEDFEITPLEGFVLGMAFLLHDSALSFEAYENGKIGLRATVNWKDAYEDLKDSLIGLEIEEIERQADFLTLRNLHASQAEKLLYYKWNANTDNELYLLENQELRNHLGKLIGQIASSHHWDIETVISTFTGQQNVPTSYPREWRIDSIKIACILRCADAAHIDNERAPDFLYALLKRNGISLDHWKAQNRLAKVDIDQSDVNKNTLLFTSTIDFPENDYSSWFVAYDAICLIDKEIKSCNLLLEQRAGLGFQIKKVKGAESPEALSLYIKASGWEPCSAKVHVGNVEKIIQNLGGEMLYGSGADNLAIALRELIQNSRDSIKAREAIDESYSGVIKIRLKKENDDFWVIIEDNGIGMSRRVLTGPLLDFGTSFWTSSLVKSEFPGLRSSKFKSIGRFGIGFYSVFMVANEVYIASKNFDGGLSEMNQLKFTNGFSLRPILSKEKPKDFTPSISTQIKLKLKNQTLKDDFLIEIKTNKMGVSNFRASFKNYLSALCAGLDVAVFYKENNNQETKIHENINSKLFNKIEWLNNISFADFQTNSIVLKNYISENISRLKPIIDNGIILGLAAITTKFQNGGQDFLNVQTVGGLAFNVHHRDGDKFIGYIDYTAKSAKRETDQYTASKIAIKQWAENQLEELIKLNLKPEEKYIASSALCDFSIDPTELAMILTIYNGRAVFLSFRELVELSKTMGIALIKSNIGSGEHIEMYHRIQALPGYALIRPLSNSKFLSLKTISQIPENNFSILDCLYRAVIDSGYTPILQEIKNVGVDSFGLQIGALILSSNFTPNNGFAKLAENPL